MDPEGSLPLITLHAPGLCKGHVIHSEGGNSMYASTIKKCSLC